jgi:hypothetical protein
MMDADFGVHLFQVVWKIRVSGSPLARVTLP